MFTFCFTGATHNPVKLLCLNCNITLKQIREKICSTWQPFSSSKIHKKSRKESGLHGYHPRISLQLSNIPAAWGILAHKIRTAPFLNPVVFILSSSVLALVGQLPVHGHHETARPKCSCSWICFTFFSLYGALGLSSTSNVCPSTANITYNSRVILSWTSKLLLEYIKGFLSRVE